jgi:dolichol-phosphate mannosyltransferase
MATTRGERAKWVQDLPTMVAPMSLSLSAWLILPTYNERENLARLVSAIHETLAESAPSHTILIVDDSSPDGTGELADELAGADPKLRVLHREKKEGLGRAYVAGFRRALEDGADLVFEMDADFSHDPAYLPDMIKAAGDADLVLGSRYVPGGGVQHWGRGRQFVSRCGCWYARKLLKIDVRDLTGGFKCFRRSVLEAVDLDALHAHGYTFQVELTYRAVQMDFSVVEVPIVFSDRRVGESKMTPGIVVEAVWRVPAMRWGNPSRNGHPNGRRNGRLKARQRSSS